VVLLQNHGWCLAGKKCQHSHDIDLILEYEHRGHLSKKQRRSKKKLKNVETLMDTVLTVGDGNSTTDGCHSGDVSESVTNVADDGVQLASELKAESAEVVALDKNSLGHRAGSDAFMTGCLFAWSIVAYGQSSAPDHVPGTTPACDITNTEFVNRVYLGGKDFPLQVTHSSFAKPSKCHLEKWRLINNVTDSQ